LRLRRSKEHPTPKKRAAPNTGGAVFLWDPTNGISFFRVGPDQKIVGTGMMEIGQSNQNAGLDIHLAPLIIAVNPLTTIQILGQLRLRQILIFTQISDSPVHSHPNAIIGTHRLRYIF